MTVYTLNLTIVKDPPPIARKVPVASEELSEAQLVIGGTVVCIVITILVFYFIHFKQTYQRKMKEMPIGPPPGLSREQVA